MPRPVQADSTAQVNGHLVAPAVAPVPTRSTSLSWASRLSAPVSLGPPRWSQHAALPKAAGSSSRGGSFISQPVSLRHSHKWMQLYMSLEDQAPAVAWLVTEQGLQGDRGYGVLQATHIHVAP